MRWLVTVAPAILIACASAQEIAPAPELPPWNQWGGPQRVFFLGTAGRLSCLWRTDGELLWARELEEDFPGARAKRGYAASPMLAGGLVIVPVGAPGAAVVAFDPEGGETAWSRHDYGADYASPITIERDGRNSLICQLEEEIVALRPSDGELLWRLESRSDRTRQVISPLALAPNALLASTTWSVRRLELGVDPPRVAWETRRICAQVGNLLFDPDQNMVLGASSTSTGALLVALDSDSVNSSGGAAASTPGSCG